MELRALPTPAQVSGSNVSINMVKLLPVSGPKISLMNNACVGAITADIEAAHAVSEQLFTEKGSGR
eukprot:2818924-Prorocentrum_lima.AAC.1